MGTDYDLIKTIEDDEEVPNYSENSDEEEDVSGDDVNIIWTKKFFQRCSRTRNKSIFPFVVVVDDVDCD